MTLLRIETARDMEAFGRFLGSHLLAGDIVVLTGSLGAGKTTLTRGIGEALGITSPVQSPTFIVAREHARTAPDQPPLVHVDAYRVGSPAEFDDLDIDWSGSISVVEWGSAVVSAVAREWIEVTLVPEASGGRDGSISDDTDVPRNLIIEAHSLDENPSQHLQSVVEASSDFGH